MVHFEMIRWPDVHCGGVTMSQICTLFVNVLPYMLYIDDYNIFSMCFDSSQVSGFQANGQIDYGTQGGDSYTWRRR